MKAIPDTDPNDILLSAAASLLTDKRKDAESRVKQILIRQEALAESILSKERELKKLREKMDKSSQKIERLRNGDWAVLAEIEKEEQQ